MKGYPPLPSSHQLSKKYNFLIMLVDTSANDKPKFNGVKILLVILRIKNFVKQELFCSHVNTINKKRIFHFIHVNSFTSPLLVL